MLIYCNKAIVTSMNGSMTDYDYRFSGIARLYGRHHQQLIRQANILIIGLGGVGSWAVEALARSGVTQLTLVDFDDICISNTNRQLHTLDSVIGQFKVDALRERIALISPDIQVDTICQPFEPATADQILKPSYTCVIDAIDDFSAKCVLLSECYRRQISVVTTGGAGGKRDPRAIKVTDLALTHGDRFLAQVRKRLRQTYGFPRGEQPFNIPCIFSDEPAYYPTANGDVTQDPEQRPNSTLSCATGLGTATFVTGSFGFYAAAIAIEQVLAKAKATALTSLHPT